MSIKATGLHTLAAVVALVASCGRLGFDDSAEPDPDASPIPNAATLTVNLDGDGDFEIVSTPPGIDCPGTCAASFNEGASIELTAAAADGSEFGSWGASECPDSSKNCQLALAASRDLTVRIRGRRNLVFVTAVGVDMGDLVNSDEADEICNNAAAETNLPGPFIAWLSRAGLDTGDRIGDIEGFTRVDGKEVFEDADGLRNGRLLRRLQDQFGDNAERYTSASDDGGSFSGLDCEGFTNPNLTVTIGQPFRSGVAFHNSTVAPCSQSHRLLCVATDVTRSGPLARPERPSRRVFLTAADLPAGDGLVAFDSACEDEAANANLPGVFAALVAANGASAASRFDSTGLPWARGDGVLLAETAALMLEAKLDAAPQFTAANMPISKFYWAGSEDGPEAAPTATCENWTSIEMAETGAASIAGSSLHFFNAASSSCNGTRPVLCIEK